MADSNGWSAGKGVQPGYFAVVRELRRRWEAAGKSLHAIGSDYEPVCGQPGPMALRKRGERVTCPACLAGIEEQGGARG